MSSCIICFEPPNDPFKPKCGHVFCNKCILIWITQHDDCPICRGDITQTKTCESYDSGEYDEEQHYSIEINGNVRDEEYNDVMDRVDDFIDLDTENEFKWKDSTDGSSYIIIKKNKYFIDLKFDMYKILENSYNIIVTINRRIIVPYNKGHYRNVKNYNLQYNRRLRHLIR